MNSFSATALNGGETPMSASAAKYTDAVCSVFAILA